ncbi:probable histone-lysine N-methyltransferase Mes-4 [Anopheles funestus]|uniref:probable histone-lysine N-methyltransferase Mes-4 n=1 Tax=Anopheles funestus TaxID=62324 RepID=UPI0020C63150|nr:probable histone-lysine N-methyltransferase Mes-4 [Anopheles funestus]
MPSKTRPRERSSQVQKAKPKRIMRKLKRNTDEAPPPSDLETIQLKEGTSNFPENFPEKENVLSGDMRQESTDENSNNVPRSRGRYLLKQLSSSLSPKMTEINTDTERRVSRYGRHQKQKDNSDYVPVDLMRYVGNSPLKLKQKTEIAEQDIPLFVNVEQRPATEDAPVLELPKEQAEDKKLLTIEEIKIVSTDESNVDISTGNNTFTHDLIIRKHSSDADSAKGSSIDLGNGYCAGTIYWGAQSKKTIHWPCIVRIDPESGRITRMQGEKMMEVHVSFFGDKGRRGWIKEICMVPFEGVDSYCTEAKNLRYGKHVKQALRTNMLRRWKIACDLAEQYFALPVEERITKHDAEVKLELISLKISRYRMATHSDRITQQAISQLPATVQSDNQTALDSRITSFKRERSMSPESPAYEALPGLSSPENQNPMKKMKCSTPSKSSTHYGSRIDRFLQSLDNEQSTSVDAEISDNRLAETTSALSESNVEYEDVLKFIRYYMFDGRTNPEIEESLQFHVRRICYLKKASNRGTERTASRHRIQALRKTYEKLGLESMVPASSNGEIAIMKKQRLASQSTKKDPQTLEEKFIFQLDKNFLMKGIPKGFVCYVCNRPNNVTKCSKCSQHVHLYCVTDDPMQVAELQEQIDEKRFMCAICSSTPKDDQTKCFICNDGNEETQTEQKFRCTDSKCARKYHLSCLRLFPHYRTISANTIICPYHVCHTCVSNDPRGKASSVKTALTSCMKCPASYHPDGRCIPAGSEIFTTKQLVCPKHSLEQIPLNVNWCFMCCKGGDLICCETCPFACHPNCLPFTPPDGKYFCEECESGRLPLYNEIVIAKLGTFRWWPALTVPPSEIPPNVLQLRQKPSDICVKFFNSHDMAWLNRKRMYLYQDEDSENLGVGKSGSSMDRKYRSAMIEASIIFKVLQSTKLPSPSAGLGSSKATPMYTKIKMNRYIAPLKPPSVNRQLDGVEDSVCRCQPDDDDPCGPTSACLNRAIFMECSSKTCPAKERCSNQRFTKRIYPILEVRHFANKGFGLVALQDLQSGQFVIEYVGEVINNEEFERRVKTMQTAKEENYYFLTVDPDLTIDAGAKGNVSRFINHSCEPNCETQKWTIGETRVIGLFAIKDIKAGEELTFNYNLESLGNSKRVCLCGAEKCSGYIGEKYRPTKDQDQEKEKRKIRKGKVTKKMAKARKTKKGIVSKLDAGETVGNTEVHPLDNDVVLVPGPASTIVDLLDVSVPNPVALDPTVVVKSERLEESF